MDEDEVPYKSDMTECCKRAAKGEASEKMFILLENEGVWKEPDVVVVAEFEVVPAEAVTPSARLRTSEGTSSRKPLFNLSSIEYCRSEPILLLS